MSTQLPEFDPATTLGMWIPVPRPESVTDHDAWAADAAAEYCAENELDDETAAIVARLLAGLVREQPSEDAHIRLLFMVEPELGGTLWEIGFFQADHDLTLDDLVGRPADSPLGGEVSDSTFHGVAVKQAVHYLVAGADPGEVPDDRAIEAVAVTAAIRDLGGQELTVVARAYTGLLDALSVSLVPAQYLLASELFAELVSGPTSDPAGTPA